MAHVYHCAVCRLIPIHGVPSLFSLISMTPNRARCCTPGSRPVSHCPLRFSRTGTRASVSSCQTTARELQEGQRSGLVAPCQSQASHHQSKVPVGWVVLYVMTGGIASVTRMMSFVPKAALADHAKTLLLTSRPNTMSCPPDSSM